MIESNIVTNICLWDGNENTWAPPVDATMLIQAITPAMVWMLNADKTDYVLTEEVGMGSIGFTWDGVKVTTNEPKPNPPVQPVTNLPTV